MCEEFCGDAEDVQWSPELAEERAQRGADFLTEEFGNEGWAFDISPSNLQLSNTQRCVIGQVYASRPGGLDGWNKFLGKEWRTTAWMCEHGFDSIEREGYDLLDVAWRELIAKMTAPPA